MAWVFHTFWKNKLNVNLLFSWHSILHILQNFKHTKNPFPCFSHSFVFLLPDLKKMAKVVIGLSGGVDSSVAAFLLKEQGHDLLLRGHEIF